jgi:hypothetical protein
MAVVSGNPGLRALADSRAVRAGNQLRQIVIDLLSPGFWPITTLSI